MKDNELREHFDELGRRLADLDRMLKDYERGQSYREPPIWILAIVGAIGLIIGALIFFAGMYAGTFLR
jgi:hypothetical protein